MSTFAQQNEKLVTFDKTFDPADFAACVQRAMLLIKNREAQVTEEGYDWPINTESCRWAVEQAIINRAPGFTMMAAAIEYVEAVEYKAESFNGLN